MIKRTKTTALASWPSNLTPEGRKFFQTAEAVYKDWRSRGVSRILAIGFLAAAEYRSGLDPASLYGSSGSIEDQNSAAWEDLESSGLNQALAAKDVATAALVLAQYWLRFDDYDRCAAMAMRWLSSGNLDS